MSFDSKRCKITKIMKPFLFLLLLFPLWSTAQISDSFNSPDLQQPLPWTGTLNRFRVNDAHQLQLNDTVADTAWLSTPFQVPRSAEWQFWVKTDFSPSSKNYIRFYLIADCTQLSKMTNGYFLQLGEKGTHDAITLFHQTDTTLKTVCRGTDGEIARPFALRIKVTCDSSGNWTLYSDKTGGNHFEKEATGKDRQILKTGSLGIFCRYTVSYARKVFFDDLYAGPLVFDTIPPVIDSVVVSGDRTLFLYFNETLDRLSVVQKAKFRLQPAAGNLSEVILSDNKKKIELRFSEPFRRNTLYRLSVSGIADVSGNIMPRQTRMFRYVKPEFGDVVFNEIMADPTPVVGLPPVEYLELFNRDTIDLNLKGWQLVLGKSVRTFDTVTLPARGYIIVCKTDAVNALAGYGKTYGFSRFSLINSGEELQLFDCAGTLIHAVRYTTDWYGDASKAKGGWSLEQINPDNICSAADNWRASEDPRGGTPGKQNSVYRDLIFHPEVTALFVPDNQTVQLLFSQRMDTSTLKNPENYSVVPNTIRIKRLRVSDENRQVTLSFYPAIDTATAYSLNLSEKLKNCAGVEIQDTSLRFGIPQPAKKMDVVINEVLFYPLDGGSDYVELYNRSNKIIDLSDLLLGTVKHVPPNPPDSLFYTICLQQKLFFPGDYMVLTASPEKVKSQYRIKNPSAFLKVLPFPKLKKDKGSVLLYRQLCKIDAFDYTEKMQYPLLNYTQGVALERVCPDGSTNDRDNWHSAAESAGFGTPGYRNSQTAPSLKDSIAGEVTIKPEIFSPDNDGYQDLLHIYYRFETSGNTLTIQIFNRSGQCVRHLANNEYTGTQGVFAWNGLQDDGTKAPVGIYVLYFQVFDSKGHVSRFKKTAVLAAKL